MLGQRVNQKLEIICWQWWWTSQPVMIQLVVEGADYQHVWPLFPWNLAKRQVCSARPCIRLGRQHRFGEMGTHHHPCITAASPDCSSGPSLASAAAGDTGTMKFEFQ